MATCPPPGFIGKHWGKTSLLVVIFTALAIGSSNIFANEDSGEDAPANWRSEQLQQVAERIEHANSEDERLEYVARQAWLRRWEPGRMPHGPARSTSPAKLVEEPLLSELSRPAEITPDIWQQLTSAQAELLTIDTDDD